MENTYSVQNIDRRNFSLLQNNQLIGTLSYHKWGFYKCEFKLADGSTLQLSGRGFFNRKVYLNFNGQDVLLYAYSWKKIFKIESNIIGKTELYSVHKKGIFKGYFEMRNEANELLCSIFPKYNWKIFDFNYELEIEESIENNESKIILLLTALHIAIYYTKTMKN